MILPLLIAALAWPTGSAFGQQEQSRPDRREPTVLVPWFPGAAHGQTFSEGSVTALARRLASQPFVPDPPVPQELIDLDYDAYRKIAWKPEM
ncbi:MAG: glucan biosynthesis protein, partial [Planctomycetota bacterium]